MKLRMLLEDEVNLKSNHFSPEYHNHMGVTHMGLTSLEGAPAIVVQGSFNCSNNKLKSLKYSPRHVEGSFVCNDNELTSLEGAPQDVGFDFQCEGNKLTSLHDIHKHIKRINGRLFLKGNSIKSHVLGLLKIKDLTGIYLGNPFQSDDNKLEKIQVILNHHLNSGCDIFACQEQLEDFGFEEYAKL